MPHVVAFLREELFPLANTPVSLLSIIIFVVGLVVTITMARTLRRVTMGFFERRRAGGKGVAYAAGRMVQYGVIAAGTLVCLDTLGVDLGTLAAFGAVLSVGIGFGLQTITHNFISGIILLIERPIKQGDFVVVGDVVGTVTEIEMRATKVVSRDGVAMIVPNSEFISARVVNQSHPTTRKRVHVAVFVAYGSDAQHVREILTEIALANTQVLRDPKPIVMLKNFGDSSMELDLAVWLEAPDPEPMVTSELRYEIHRIFREKNIEIPFPQREVHLHQAASSEPYR